MPEPVDLVEPDIDGLYVMSPDEFVTARDALARRLRAANERGAAERVRALRKPTVAAWALNQAARSLPNRVGELASIADELRDAQERALSGGDASALRDAARRKREAVQALATAAADALTTAGRDPRPHTASISATLEAAVSDPETATALRAGRVVDEPPGDTTAGFGSFFSADIQVAKPGRGFRITGPAEMPATGPASVRSARRKAVGLAQWDHQQAQRAAAKTQTEVDAARERVMAAEADVEQHKRRLADAEELARLAAARLAEARDRHAVEQQKADAALAALEAARHDLGDFG